jgi:hypothetical protein
MEPRIKRRIVISAAGLAVVAGAGGTYAATQGSGAGERQAYLNDVAKRLDVSPNKLRSALQGAFSDRLDAAVAAGRLTRAQADAIERRAKRDGGGPPLLGGPPPFGPGPHGGPFRAGIDAAAKYLDLSEVRLHEQLESGKSLADVAKDRDKSVDGLKDAIKDAVRKQLDAAVDDKRLTKEQEQRMLDDLDSRIDEIVEHSGPRGRGPHPGFGPPPLP